MSTRSTKQKTDTPSLSDSSVGLVSLPEVESIVEKAVSAAVSVIRTEFQRLFDDLASRVNSLEGKFQQFEASELGGKSHHEITGLLTSLSECHSRLDFLETYTRVDNLIIKGLPEMYAETAAASQCIDRQHEHQLSTSDATRPSW